MVKKSARAEYGRRPLSPTGDPPRGRTPACERIGFGFHAAEAVERGHLDSNIDAEQLVWELCGIYLSHHASSRLARDPAAGKRARVAFEALLRRAGASVPIAPGKRRTKRR
jgi:hypothetical protein